MERTTATAGRSSLTGEDTPAHARASRSSVYLNGRATRTSVRRLRTDCRPVADGEVLPIGAHLLTPRRGYTHHGIYIGAGRVVHYAGFVGSRVRGPVEEVPLEAFADGRCVFVKTAGQVLYAAEAIVERARSRLGESDYRVTTNNCEHFCEWCLRGESRSEQVERWLAWPRALVRRVAVAFTFGAVLRRVRSRAVAS